MSKASGEVEFRRASRPFLFLCPSPNSEVYIFGRLGDVVLDCMS